MQKFRFELQPVLDTRRLKEDLAKRALSEAEERLDQARAMVRKIEGRIRCETAYLKTLASAEVDPERIIASQRYIDRLKAELVVAQHDVEACEAETARLKAALVERMKERKAMERLRDKAYERYKHEVARQEQAFLDELASQRYAALKEEQAGT